MNFPNQNFHFGYNNQNYQMNQNINKGYGCSSNQNLQEENKRLKQELFRKNKQLEEYKQRNYKLEQELKKYKASANQNNQNINKNNQNLNNNKNNNFQRQFSNPFQSSGFDIFNDDFFTSGISSDFPSFNPMSFFKRVQPVKINKGFNPGDYEDFYDGNIPLNYKNSNGRDINDTEQDIINQICPNPDNMTYEQLLEMEENVGSVSKGLKEFQIKKLNTFKFFKNKYKLEDNKCAICQEEFNNGELLIQLKCLHCFHNNCGTKWLKTKKECPICKKEVKV